MNSGIYGGPWQMWIAVLFCHWKANNEVQFFFLYFSGLSESIWKWQSKASWLWRKPCILTFRVQHYVLSGVTSYCLKPLKYAIFWLLVPGCFWTLQNAAISLWHHLSLVHRGCSSDSMICKSQHLDIKIPSIQPPLLEQLKATVQNDVHLNNRKEVWGYIFKCVTQLLHMSLKDLKHTNLPILCIRYCTIRTF